LRLIFGSAARGGEVILKQKGKPVPMFDKKGFGPEKRNASEW